MNRIRIKIDSMKLNIKFTIVIILVITIPIAILAGILFYYMEQNTISENESYMEYKMEKTKSQVITCMDSINMSTQFFLSDSEMDEFLNLAIQGENISTEDIIEFQQRDILNLERLVSNNPLMYSVRIYASTDNIQEMMPILYNRSRMNNMEWASDDDIYGWKIGYHDTAFSSLITNQNEKLIGLVTSFTDYRNGEIGVIEATMDMSTMFPVLYEDIEGEWACFVSDDGRMYFGDNEPENAKELLSCFLEEKNQDPDDNNPVYYTVCGKKYIVSFLDEDEMGGTLVSVSDITGNINQVYFIRNVFVGIMALILIGLAFLINVIVRRMLRQFYDILKTVRKIQKGNLDERINTYTYDEMGELANQMNKMLDKIQELNQDNINREVLVKNSQIRALQNQINAHFIYNVLESIKMMAEIDEEYEISDAITALGKLLRYSMRWVSGNVLVKDELDYIKNYMVLINLRYDFVIHLSINMPDKIYDEEIPKMSLQPLVENGILHGIEPLGEESTIYIKGWYEKEDCIIEVTDMGKGMSQEDLEYLNNKLEGEIDASGSRGSGIGVKNVQDRIKIAFGDKYGLSISTKTDCYTKIAIRFPGRKRKK